MTGAELAIRGEKTFGEVGQDLMKTALMTPWMARIEEHPSWEVLSQLRVSLRAVVSLNRFRVRDLLTLKEGQVFESISSETQDVTLLAGQVQLGWSEFEVLEQRIAVRMTRLK